MDPEKGINETIHEMLKTIHGQYIPLPIWGMFVNDIAFYNRFLPSRVKNTVNDYLDYILQNDIMHFSIPAESVLYRSRKISREGIKKDAEGNFTGYSKEQSGMPPYRKAPYGRVGTSGIPVLYTASDLKTCCAEQRPVKGEYISVAEYKVTKNLLVANFTLDQIDAFDGIPEGKVFLNEMFMSFSMPVTSEYIDYLPSEYISEYIRQKHKSLNGIRYSSLHNIGGYNIALFDDACCEFVRSYVVQCAYLDYKFQNISDINSFS